MNRDFAGFLRLNYHVPPAHHPYNWVLLVYETKSLKIDRTAINGHLIGVVRPYFFQLAAELIGLDAIRDIQAFTNLRLADIFFFLPLFATILFFAVDDVRFIPGPDPEITDFIPRVDGPFERFLGRRGASAQAYCNQHKKDDLFHHLPP
jgi:hypothetical protein